ncbi:hypothetical protein GLOIN_2v1817937 [Rhizophagus irregularis DAOM 181602=DAOM 197198]|nr:hypothetical protein GLOIN_2v1817937 [Rhizophagus irregularis DAOM 181602=DAOM 197198]
MSTTGNYIGFEELISYLNESRNFSYHGFLKHNRNTIIASLTQLTNSSLTTNVSLTSEKWKNFNITWNNRFLDNAKELLDSHTFAELKKKEYEKENTFTTITPLSKKPNKFSETLQSKENNFNTVKSLSKTLQPDISLLSKKTAYESLVVGNIIPFIEILKTFLLTRSKMSLSSANESMLQAIIESLLPLKYRIPELSLVMDGKKLKGSGRFGYSDIFVLKGIGDIYYISLELKYISLVGLIKNQKAKYGANELENLDKILEKENEEDLLKRPYTYWSKEHKRTNQTTIGEVLNSGISQLESYMNTISKGRVVDYSSSGIFDKRVKIVKSNPNKLKGFVILVIGFRRILWKPVDEVISNYTYNVI